MTISYALSPLQDLKLAYLLQERLYVSYILNIVAVYSIPYVIIYIVRTLNPS
jgi:hypothetical protein